MEERQEFWVRLWAQKGAEPKCPFCGEDRWIGWRDRVRLEQVSGGEVLWPEGVEVIPLTCSECGFVRFQNPSFMTVEVT
jgi:hypothetical protein